MAVSDTLERSPSKGKRRKRHPIVLARERFADTAPELEVHVILDAIMLAHAKGAAGRGMLDEMLTIARTYLARHRVLPRSDRNAARDLVKRIAKEMPDQGDDELDYSTRRLLRTRFAAQITPICLSVCVAAMHELGWGRPEGTPQQIERPRARRSRIGGGDD